jgi:hypothetical protein
MGEQRSYSQPAGSSATKNKVFPDQARLVARHCIKSLDAIQGQGQGQRTRNRATDKGMALHPQCALCSVKEGLDWVRIGRTELVALATPVAAFHLTPHSAAVSLFSPHQQTCIRGCEGVGSTEECCGFAGDDDVLIPANMCSFSAR